MKTPFSDNRELHCRRCSGGRPHQRENAGRGRVPGGSGGPGGQSVPRGHADPREAAGRRHGRLHLPAQVSGLHTKQRLV